ncbi:putative flippase GtrA [Anaerobacterium chartisolvens]|uniref:Putative flippase GtrA n=1 Tax=Anaerobacterium chartisolvens TaxID=1297424 RepID=A0A369BBY1_9FIRM|nr:GtrA family protein [Anaerobacterium chartisolvens]RCX18855.1 putative flippase GtrA [Anaerobacterium chartisolvens]
MKKITIYSYQIFIKKLLQRYKDLIRFALIGILNTSIDFLTFSMLHKLFSVYYVTSQFAAYLAGTANSFILNKIWTFENRRVSVGIHLQILKFLMINMISLALSIIGLKFIIEQLGVNIYIAKILVTIMAQGVNFTGYKIWVFKNK